MAETDNLKLALPASNEYVDVEVLNENFRKIDTSVLLALAAAAPYSSEQTYALGAYCTRGGKLYRCTTAISTAEVWTDAHWTETTMGAELVAISITLANKAPAGFGLGGYPKSIDSWDDALVNGWYMAPAPSGVGSGNIWGRVDCLSAAYLVQTVYADNYKSSARRFRIGSVFGEWEWIDPPMHTGVEYRTTERYRGKPVYTRLVDFGSFPNSTQKDVRFPENGFLAEDVCIDFTKSVVTYPNDTRTSILPFKNGITEISVNNACVRVTTSSDLSSASGYICVKYTKSTD